MNEAITLNSILVTFGTIVAIVAGITAIIAIIKWITNIHDKVQKWDGYENTMNECQTDINAKLQQIMAEQYTLTNAMLAVLAGLKQQGCNGPVTEAYDDLMEHLNEKAHEVIKKEGKDVIR